MSENGKLPDSELSPVPNGRLSHDAAAAWLALRSHIGKEKGIWIQPGGPRSSYRKFADQVFFWELFQSGKGNPAARPGTSNHGLGRAVDLPDGAESMKAAVRQHGHKFGWGIPGGQLPGDAPGEDWHCTYHPGKFTPPKRPKHKHPYHFMNDREQAARDVLVKERRIAKRNGGWDKVDAGHAKRAVEAKSRLRQCGRDIAVAAKESGWDKAHRKARFDYINKLTGA